MKLKQLVAVVVFLIIGIKVNAQGDIQELVKDGIEHHDQGRYDEAIEVYKQALKLDPQSLLIHYELSFSYFKNGDYKRAIKHSDKVLKGKTKYALPATITKGSSLDMLGKTKESIKLFKKAIKEQGEHYLLCFNLAINYYKTQDLEAAEKYLVKGINNNPNHASSHYILANLHNQKGNKVQSLMASYYFLMLEPNTQRSQIALKILNHHFGKGVSKDKDKPNTINISVSPNKDDDFSGVELMVAMLKAANSTEENRDKTEAVLFLENTTSFFSLLGEGKKKKNKEIWWSLYGPFFSKLGQSEHMEAYCNYITQVANENARDWIKDHRVEVSKFKHWLKS